MIHLNLFENGKSICRILSLKLHVNVLLLKYNLLKRSSLSTDYLHFHISVDVVYRIVFLGSLVSGVELSILVPLENCLDC